MTISRLHFTPWRQRCLAAMLALVALLGFSGLAAAEDVTDPPRVQNVGNYRIDFIEPDGGNHDALQNITFRFIVVAQQGSLPENVQLNLTAIRDYSGQVKKEHNGPRTPNIGPVPLKSNGKPGQYEATINFAINGHYYIQVDGPTFGKDKATFRLPIGAAENIGAGVDLDWLLWPLVALVVAGIVGFFALGKRGEVFAVPADELEPPTPAPPLVKPEEPSQDDLAAASSTTSQR